MHLIGRHPTREFDVPEDFKEHNFLDALCDTFTPLECLPLSRPDCGWIAIVRDGMRIRESFEKAIYRLDDDEERVISLFYF